jgi:hypothetical protein
VSGTIKNHWIVLLSVPAILHLIGWLMARQHKLLEGTFPTPHVVRRLLVLAAIFIRRHRFGLSSNSILAGIIVAAFLAYSEQHHTLAEIGSDRPFDYDRLNLELQRTSTPNVYFATVTLGFKNVGEKGISYKINNIYLTFNGIEATNIAQLHKAVFLPAHQTRTYTFATFENVRIEKMPIKLLFGWSIEYDNLPPVAKRITERDIEDTVVSVAPVMNHDLILREEEK